MWLTLTLKITREQQNTINIQGRYPHLSDFVKTNKQAYKQASKQTNKPKQPPPQKKTKQKTTTTNKQTKNQNKKKTTTKTPVPRITMNLWLTFGLFLAIKDQLFFFILFF